MNLNFTNWYTFELTFGIFSIISGFYWLKIHILFIILIICGIIATFDAIRRWDSSQRTKDRLDKLDLERKEAILNFEIKDVEAERDIDWYPDDVVNGEPIGYNEEPVTSYKISLMVYNPCSIENIVKGIEVSIPNRKKVADRVISSISDINGIPLTIAPRSYQPIVFNRGVSNMDGKKVIK